MQHAWRMCSSSVTCSLKPAVTPRYELFDDEEFYEGSGGQGQSHTVCEEHGRGNKAILVQPDDVLAYLQAQCLMMCMLEGIRL